MRPQGASLQGRRLWARCFGTAVLLLLIALEVGQAAARSWHVRLDGSGDFTVIQDAIEAAAPGDSILIGPGRFDQFRLVTFQSGGSAAVFMSPRTGPLTIVGAGQDSTIVGPADPVYTYMGNDTAGYIPEVATTGSSVQGVTFEHTYWLGVLSSVGASFQGCRFREGLQGIAIDNSTGILFENCHFKGRMPDTSTYYAITSFNGGDNDSLTVSGCEFEWDGPIKLDGFQNAWILDTTFTDTYSVYAISSNVTIERCRAISPAPFPAVFDADTQSTMRIVATYVDAGGGASVAHDGPPNPQGLPDAERCRFLSGTAANVILRNALWFDECDLINEGGTLGTVYVSSSMATDPPANFRNNYWGLTDSTQIANWIHDGVDSPSTARIVEFMPFLDQSVPVPVRSFGGLKSLFKVEEE